MGLLEAVAGAPCAGEADLPVIAASLQMEIDDLFPVAETLQMLRFAELVGGDIRLPPEGKRSPKPTSTNASSCFQNTC